MDLHIVGSGLGRTGTMSLKFALELLTGQPSYHVIELLKDPGRLPLLKEGHAKGNTDWAQFYRGYGSAVDYPGCLFIPELLALNPQLKVIHTTREPEEWYESVARTIYRGVPKGPRDIFRMIWNSIRSKEFRRVAPVFMYNNKLIWKGQFEGKFADREFAMEVFRRHEAHIREVVPPEQLLWFDVKDGWEPLCSFLQVPVPTDPFPRANQRDEFNAKMDKLLLEGKFVP